MLNGIKTDTHLLKTNCDRLTWQLSLIGQGHCLADRGITTGFPHGKWLAKTDDHRG